MGNETGQVEPAQEKIEPGVIGVRPDDRYSQFPPMNLAPMQSKLDEFAKALRIDNRGEQ